MLTFMPTVLLLAKDTVVLELMARVWRWLDNLFHHFRQVVIPVENIIWTFLL